MVDPINIQRPAVSLPNQAQTAAKPGAAAERPESAASSIAAQRSQANAAILQANQQVSLNSGNEPLALLYSAAIDAINLELAPELGENALQRGVEQGLDISPEATAERIVSLSTAMFARFQEHHNELSFEQQVERFVEVIGSGIDRGFAEAREILDGLKVLEGGIAELIDQTYLEVQQQLQEFKDGLLGSPAGSDSPESE
jgi:uncharacterized protein (DUF2384 family)